VLFFSFRLGKILFRFWDNKLQFWPERLHISKKRNYDVYGPVRNAFDAVKSITRASGRGLGPGNQRGYYMRNTFLVVQTLHAVQCTVGYKDFNNLGALTR
jgi:hypothetical protein